MFCVFQKCLTPVLCTSELCFVTLYYRYLLYFWFCTAMWNRIQWKLSFCHGVNEICAVLGFYTVYIGSLLLIFWDNIIPIFMGQAVFLNCLTHEDGSNRLSQNVGNKPPFCAL